MEEQGGTVSVGASENVCFALHPIASTSEPAFSLPPQSTMLQAVERYMKQAIVDKVPSVSSSALVSSLVRSWAAACKAGVKVE